MPTTLCLVLEQNSDARWASARDLDPEAIPKGFSPSRVVSVKPEQLHITIEAPGPLGSEGRVYLHQEWDEAFLTWHVAGVYLDEEDAPKGTPLVYFYVTER